MNIRSWNVISGCVAGLALSMNIAFAQDATTRPVDSTSGPNQVTNSTAGSPNTNEGTPITSGSGLSSTSSTGNDAYRSSAINSTASDNADTTPKGNGYSWIGLLGLLGLVGLMGQGRTTHRTTSGTVHSPSGKTTA